MNLGTDHRTHIQRSFEPIRRRGGTAMPALAKLANTLRTACPHAGTGRVNLDPNTASLFATGSVECWLRSVHSYLVSCAATNTSPIWSAISGYYASHYSVRAICHLFGFFQMYSPNKKVQLDLQGGGAVCSFDPKGNSREHSSYWTMLSKHPLTGGTGLFPTNADRDEHSEVAHRNRATYADHINRFPNFAPLQEQQLRDRLQRLSNVEFTSVPRPQAEKFPDLVPVQVIAYHRLIYFRRLLDEALGNQNKFWSNFRKPQWASEYLDFQLVAPTGVVAPRA